MSTRTVATRLVVCFVASLSLPLSASAQAALSLSQTTFNVQGTADVSAPSQSVTVSNTGNRSLKWSVSSPNVPWMNVSPTAGVNRGTVSISISPLPQGSYTGSFNVTASGSSIPVTVNLAIGAAATPITPSTATLTGLIVSGQTSVNVAQTAQYTAKATYSDGTSKTLSGPTVWWYTRENTATIDHATGILTGVASGAASVRFDYVQGSVITGSTAYPISVVAAGGGTLALTCPANMTVTSSSGSAVPVTFTASTSGGVAPVTLSYNPLSGSAFPVGTTSVSVSAQSSDGQRASCSFAVSVTYAAPSVSSTAVGPQASITCPAGAVDIFPGTNIQNYVNLYGGTTTFCLKAGTHSITSPITPKTGNTFVGEYGAVLDGTGWTTSDPSYTQAAFRAHNQDIDSVTIRNLVIRNMPQRGIHTYSSGSCANGTCTFSTAGADRWTVEYNEIHHNLTGLTASNGMMVRNNYIHHNVGPDPYSSNDRLRGGGFESLLAQGVVFDHNEISYNGQMQKVASLSPNTIFRNNFVHHNLGNGVWYDGENPGSLIENNIVEDNVGMGIFYEVSGQGVIRNNAIRRNTDNGILIATSHSVDIYGNTLADNFRAINFFVNCAAVNSPYGGEIGEEIYMQDVSAHDNTITVGTRSGAWANALTSYSCDASSLLPYTNGSKNLTFTHNTYYVPSLTAWYWVWGAAAEYWSQWQALGQDTTGTVIKQ